MKTSSFKQAIEAQFDCLSKKVIKRAVKKGYRDMKRREKHECLFSDIPDYEQSRFGELDKYESDYTVFNILGIEVTDDHRRAGGIGRPLTVISKLATQGADGKRRRVQRWQWQRAKLAEIV